MTLHAPYDPENIFAKILRGDMPSVKVFEDEVALAFMDVFPQAEGHTLIIPKQEQARNFLELRPQAIGDYMQRVQRVASAVEKGLEPDGIILTQFNGSAAGQTVFHLHFHILPRWEGQPLKPHGSGGMAEIEKLEEIARKIRPFLT